MKIQDKVKNKIITNWSDELSSKFDRAQAILTIKEGSRVSSRDVMDKILDAFIADHKINV